ncbi:hypothetical protein J2T13_002676 [Paenibacillus sp. DS2015]|uniref:pyridoxamine 5'-phosphate oxidase family protein n=1 Tax=Paenibacillus sp. DS2015 TaxID=3373917 RepID=UPI003D1C6B66
MGRRFDSIQVEHDAFIRRQHMFFVASAPLSPEGHVNLSPKGYDTFRILSSTEVAYLDLTGSGNETSAHLMENGRITVMFTAFEGPPMIVRLFGTGSVVLPHMEEWDSLIGQFNSLPGVRQIIKVQVDLVTSSCGFSIPFFAYQGEREQLIKWADGLDEEQLEQYRAKKNDVSIDQMPTPLGERRMSGRN